GVGADGGDEVRGRGAAGAGAGGVVGVAFGSDRVKIGYVLDIGVGQGASRLGLPMARAATPGTEPRFVSMITELVSERLGQPAQMQALGSLPPGPDFCPNDCCRMPAARPPPAPRPGPPPRPLP